MCISQVNTNMNKYERFMEHKGHLERLAQIRTGIDTKAPKLPSFLAKKFIDPGVRMEKNRQINYENRVIYNRMCDIHNHTSPYSACMNIPSKCPAYELLTYHRLKKQDDIHSENGKLHKKFVFSKPTYSHSKMNEEYKYIEYLEKNISENVNRINPNLDFVTYKKFDNNLQKEKNKKNKSNRNQSYKNNNYYNKNQSANRTFDMNNFPKNHQNLNNMKMGNNNLNINDLPNYNSNKYNTLNISVEEKYKSCYSKPTESYNNYINNKNNCSNKYRNRPNSCKPSIAISREIQEPSEYLSKCINTNSNISYKTKPSSSKTRTNGSDSTNVLTMP